jgi:hypothetical protein
MVFGRAHDHPRVPLRRRMSEEGGYRPGNWKSAPTTESASAALQRITPTPLTVYGRGRLAQGMTPRGRELRTLWPEVAAEWLLFSLGPIMLVVGPSGTLPHALDIRSRRPHLRRNNRERI